MFDEYDLYNVVHAGVKTPKKSPLRSLSPPPAALPRKSVLLTAKSLDSHFTNGRHDWCLLDCGCDMYRTLVKSIRDPVESRLRLEPGDPVFFDFQPLSTRLALMTRMIEHAQGGTAQPPPGYVTIYEAMSSTTVRSKSFDNSLLRSGVGGSSGGRTSSPEPASSRGMRPTRGVIMANSGMYVKIWVNDEVKMSIFGTDPFTRMNRYTHEACKFVPPSTTAKTIKSARSSKISQLMSNFEPTSAKPDAKTVWTESTQSEASMTKVSNGDLLNSTSLTNSNKTTLTKSQSDYDTNARLVSANTVSNMERINKTTTTNIINHQKPDVAPPPPPPPASVSLSQPTTVPPQPSSSSQQRVSIPIRIDDPSLVNSTQTTPGGGGSGTTTKTEIFSYSYRKSLGADATTSSQQPSIKTRGSSTESGKKIRFDDSWDKATDKVISNGTTSQRKLLRSSEWALTRQQAIKKDF